MQSPCNMGIAMMTHLSFDEATSKKLMDQTLLQSQVGKDPKIVAQPRPPYVSFHRTRWLTTSDFHSFDRFWQNLSVSAWILHVHPDFTNALHFLPVHLQLLIHSSLQNEMEKGKIISVIWWIPKKKTAEKIMTTKILSQAYYCT